MGELNSWIFAPTGAKAAVAPPTLGSSAPSTDKLVLPREDGKPVVIAFLRHCGCPFSEKTILQMRPVAEAHPNIHFIAVSHSDQGSTERWLESVGGQGKIEVVVDAESELYARWGLGVSGFGHIFNLETLKGIYNIISVDKIWNKPTESGSRWQTAGTWAADGNGTLIWGGPAKGAHEVPDLEAAIASIDGKAGVSKL